ncbi:hypothetical protein B566_EDAN004136 [Ephemera danica]|nr:hypothetical protein B566_EDAN004136 [Ephemera danica]
MSRYSFGHSDGFSYVPCSCDRTLRLPLRPPDCSLLCRCPPPPSVSHLVLLHHQGSPPVYEQLECPMLITRTSRSNNRRSTCDVTGATRPLDACGRASALSQRLLRDTMGNYSTLRVAEQGDDNDFQSRQLHLIIMQTFTFRAIYNLYNKSLLCKLTWDIRNWCISDVSIMWHSGETKGGGLDMDYHEPLANGLCAQSEFNLPHQKLCIAAENDKLMHFGHEDFYTRFTYSKKVSFLQLTLLSLPHFLLSLPHYLPSLPSPPALPHYLHPLPSPPALPHYLHPLPPCYHSLPALTQSLFFLPPITHYLPSLPAITPSPPALPPYTHPLHALPPSQLSLTICPPSFSTVNWIVFLTLNIFSSILSFLQLTLLSLPTCTSPSLPAITHSLHSLPHFLLSLPHYLPSLPSLLHHLHSLTTCTLSLTPCTNSVPVLPPSHHSLPALPPCYHSLTTCTPSLHSPTTCTSPLPAITHYLPSVPSLPPSLLSLLHHLHPLPSCYHSLPALT